MGPHSSTLAWRIPWMEELGRPWSMGLRRVWHDWVTLLSLFTFTHWRRKWQPTPAFLLENPRDGGAWWAAVYGVAQSRTRLKRLSSSSSSSFIGSLTYEENNAHQGHVLNYKDPFLHFWIQVVHQCFFIYSGHVLQIGSRLLELVLFPNQC